MKSRQILPLKRRRLGKTDYRQRYRLLASGKPRLIFRKKTKNIIMQIIKYNPKGDTVIITSTTKELEKYGWNIARRNTPAAYLIGYLTGLKSKSKDIVEVIYDVGLHKTTKGSIMFAALKGAIDAGLKIPHSPDLFPNQDRITGKHLKNNPFEKTLANIKNKFVIKQNVKPQITE